MHFGSLALFQPSILTGPRKERRIGERIGIGVMKVLDPLLFGSLSKYRPMPHDVLAKALVHAALMPVPGTHRNAYREIRRLAEI
jgi:hypothetical protein